jgi:hypothetical protein
MMETMRTNLNDFNGEFHNVFSIGSESFIADSHANEGNAFEGAASEHGIIATWRK